MPVLLASYKMWTVISIQVTAKIHWRQQQQKMSTSRSATPVPEHCVLSLRSMSLADSNSN
jgi:hypothetical protein